MTMTIIMTPEVFETGYTWDHYLAKEVRRNKQRLNELYNQSKIIADHIPSPDELTKTAPFWVLVAEDWCSDSIRALPVIARIAEKGNANLRIWPRDKNPEIMDHYLTDNKRKIPVLVFYNKDFKEIARWVERPQGSEQHLQQIKFGIAQNNIDLAKLSSHSLNLASDICKLIGK